MSCGISTVRGISIIIPILIRAREGQATEHGFTCLVCIADINEIGEEIKRYMASYCKGCTGKCHN